MIAALLVLAFAALVLAAAVCDVATMEIPNRISVAIIALAPIAALLGAMSWPELGARLAFGAAVFLAAFAAFNFNLMGGGDAKLITAIAVFVGAGAFIPFLMAMAVAGGALAALVLVARKIFTPESARWAFARRLLDPARGAPYAVAIAAGAAFVLPRLLSPMTS